MHLLTRDKVLTKTKWCILFPKTSTFSVILIYRQLSSKVPNTYQVTPKKNIINNEWHINFQDKITHKTKTAVQLLSKIVFEKCIINKILQEIAFFSASLKL
jgi:hypothetical protein